MIHKMFKQRGNITRCGIELPKTSPRATHNWALVTCEECLRHRSKMSYMESGQLMREPVIVNMDKLRSFFKR